MSTRITVANTFEQQTCDRLLEVLAPAYPGITDPHALGGTWLVRVDESDNILACVHVYRDKPFAYIDHLVCQSGRGHGLRLAAVLVRLLQADGYTRILANIRQDNKLMVRAMTYLRGGNPPQNGPYYLVDLARSE